MGVQSAIAKGTLRGKRLQGGFALLWVLSALLVATIGVLSIEAEWRDLYIDRQTDRAQDRALFEAKRRLEKWYRTRTTQSEPQNFASAQPLSDLQTLIQLDNIRPAVRLVRAPVRFSTQGVAYSRYLLWIPSGLGTDNTGWDGSTDSWRIPTDVRAVEFSGFDIQMERFAESLRRAQALAQRLEVWFAWQVAGDPSHEMGRNYFRAKNCMSPTSNELACYAVNSAVGATDLGVRIGITASSFSDAWGRDLEIDNVPAATGGDVPPFKVRVRFVPPGTADTTSSGVNRNLTFPVSVTAIQRIS